jgi:hypothetical protein
MIWTVSGQTVFKVEREIAAQADHAFFADFSHKQLLSHLVHSPCFW